MNLYRNVREVIISCAKIEYGVVISIKIIMNDKIVLSKSKKPLSEDTISGYLVKTCFITTTTTSTRSNETKIYYAVFLIKSYLCKHPTFVFRS